MDFVCWDSKLHDLDDIGCIVFVVLLFNLFMQLLGSLFQIGFKLFWIRRALALHNEFFFLCFSLFGAC